MAPHEAPWVSIARRKQAARDALIPSKWHISSSLIPKDPPRLEDGPQNVLGVPRQVLSGEETDLTENYTVASLLSAIKNKKLSVSQVTEAFCHRAAIAQQLTNCITEPLFEFAMERAGFLDKYQQQHGTTFGPLHGLPITMKDAFNIKGYDSTTGLASLCFKPATSNAPLVDLLLSLGGVIVAKTNVPQTMASLDSINNVFGRTMNPVNRLCTAGGSSGGEGVTVAMRACMVGIGTDIGGSIRVPAYANGVYGFKPSNGRLPYGGQAPTSTEGISRAGVQAVAGPIGRSMEDINAVLQEVLPRAHLWGEDCVPCSWPSTGLKGSGPKGEIVFGVLRSDGNCRLLPPIDKILSEVAERLGNSPNIKVMELKTPRAWTRCQSVMSKLMGIDGARRMAELIESTGEPMVPWMQTRFRKGEPRLLPDVAGLQAQRSALEREMLKLWVEDDPSGRRRSKMDAIICPLASHPVPAIEKYNAVGYTSSWVLLDYPAGAMPIRDFVQDDLELGKPMTGKPISSWDERSVELWDEKVMDRRVYLGTQLSVQVVTQRLEDEKLAQVMARMDAVLRAGGPTARSKL